MIEQIKPDKRYLLSQNEDLNLNLVLKTNFNDLNEFNNTRIISLSELFTKERNESTRYRIYGLINYLSFLRNKNKNVKTFTDLFNDDSSINIFNLEDYFDLKLYKLAPQQTYFNNTTNHYIEKLTALTSENDFKLSYYGYSKNIFNEKDYSFTFNTVNMNPNEIIKLDNNLIYNNNLYLGFIPKNNLILHEKVYQSNDYVNYIDPLTEFGYNEQDYTDALLQNIYDLTEFNLNEFKKYFLDKLKYFLKIYNIKLTLQNINLNIRFIRNYLQIGNDDYSNSISLDLTQQTLEGDFIEFDKENYLFNRKIRKEYLINLELIDTFNGVASDYNIWKNENGYTSYTYTETTISASETQLKIVFRFKFNPFYPIELKKYTTFLEEVFTDIPNIAKPPDNAIISGNTAIWRNLMEYGDPDNYDNPFINNTHYFFNDIIFMMKPDFSDKNTVILLNDFTINFANRRYNFNKSNVKIQPQTKPPLCN